MKKAFTISLLTFVILACNNDKKPVEQTTTPDSINNAPSQSAGADSIAIKAMGDSTIDPADSVRK